MNDNDESAPEPLSRWDAFWVYGVLLGIPSAVVGWLIWRNMGG